MPWSVDLSSFGSRWKNYDPKTRRGDPSTPVGATTLNAGEGVTKAAIVEVREAVDGTVSSVAGKLDATTAVATYSRKRSPNAPTGALRTLATGQHNGFAHAVTLPDGKNLVAWRVGANHAPSKGALWIARYSTAGAAVTAPFEAVVDATYDLRDPGLCVLADGSVLLTFFVYDPTGSGTPVLNGCRAARSTDGGLTWSAPVVVPSAFTSGANGFSASAGPAIQLADGSILLPTYGRSGGTQWQQAHVSRSADGGSTWAPWSVIAAAEGRHFEEPNLIVTDLGDILAAVRHEGDAANIWTARSADGGKTWTGLAAAFPGSAAPRLTITASGYLFALYRSASTGRPLRIASANSGHTWGDPVELPYSTSRPSMAYGAALPYGTESLRYFYTLQAADTSVADLVAVDAVATQDRVTTPTSCRVHRSTAQTISNGNVTAIAFDAEDWDTAAMHDTGTFASRVTVPAGRDGYYIVKGTIAFTSIAATSGHRQARIHKNGALWPGGLNNKAPVPGATTYVPVFDTVYLSAGDYVELAAFQTSDPASSVNIDSSQTYLTVTAVAAPF